MQVRLCQFQMRIVWSSDADTIQGYLLVELHCANVVQVAQEGEEAAPHLVVPHLDLVVIACHSPSNIGKTAHHLLQSAPVKLVAGHEP